MTVDNCNMLYSNLSRGLLNVSKVAFNSLLHVLQEVHTFVQASGHPLYPLTRNATGNNVLRRCLVIMMLLFWRYQSVSASPIIGSSNSVKLAVVQDLGGPLIVVVCLPKLLCSRPCQPQTRLHILPRQLLIRLRGVMYSPLSNASAHNLNDSSRIPRSLPMYLLHRRRRLFARLAR